MAFQGDKQRFPFCNANNKLAHCSSNCKLILIIRKLTPKNSLPFRFGAAGDILKQNFIVSMPEKCTYRSRDSFPPPQEEITMRDLVYLVIEMQQEITKLVHAFQEIKRVQTIILENKNSTTRNKTKFNMNQKIPGADRMTTKEVMQLLKLSKRTIQNYRNEGKIPFEKFNGRIYYSRSEIERHMDKFVVKKKE